MKSVQWGIVGTGFHATNNLLRSFAQAPGAELRAIAGTSVEKAEAAAAGLAGVKAYGKLEELAADPAIEAVFLATPSHLHVPHGFAVISAKKHLLLETPMALSVDGAHKLREAAKKQGVKLGIGYQLRHHPVVQALQSAVARGEAGEISFCSARLGAKIEWPDNWWRNPLYAGPACLMGMGIHGIDLLRWIKGREVAEVTAVARGGSGGTVNTHFSVLMTFEDGSQGVVVAGSEMPFASNDVVVYGSRARLTAEDVLAMLPPRGRLNVADSQGVRTLDVAPANPYAAEIAAFSAHVTEGTEFHADPVDGRQSVQIACAAIESAKVKRAVRVGEILRLIG